MSAVQCSVDVVWVLEEQGIVILKQDYSLGQGAFVPDSLFHSTHHSLSIFLHPSHSKGTTLLVGAFLCIV